MKKIFHCVHCDSTWTIDISKVDNDEILCPFCHEKIHEDSSFSLELKKIIEIYGEEIFLNVKRFYFLIKDSIHGYEDEKDLFKALMPTGIVEKTYENRFNIDNIKMEIYRVNIKYYFDKKKITELVNYLLESLNINYDLKIKEEKEAPLEVLLYLEGEKYEQKLLYKKAFFYYEQSAEKGYAKAEYKLGIFYLEAKGVERNNRLAFYWFKNAASKNHIEAIKELIKCYRNGVGTTVDNKEANKWEDKLNSLL